MFTAMNLATFRRQAEISQAGFARLLTEAGSPASQALISQWESGVPVPAERCVLIERVTGGAVRRIDLRPDLFAPPAANDDTGPAPDFAEEG